MSVSIKPKKELWVRNLPEYQAATARFTQLRGLSSDNPRYQEASQRFCMAAGRILLDIAFTQNLSEHGQCLAEKVKGTLSHHQSQIESSVKKLLIEKDYFQAFQLISSMNDHEARRRSLVEALNQVSSERSPEVYWDEIAKKFEEIGDHVEAQRVLANKHNFEQEVLPRLINSGKIITSAGALALSVYDLDSFVDPDQDDSSKFLTQLAAKKTAAFFGIHKSEKGVLPRGKGSNFYQNFIDHFLQTKPNKPNLSPQMSEEEVIAALEASSRHVEPDSFTRIMEKEIVPALEASSFHQYNDDWKSLAQSISSGKLTFIDSGWSGHEVTLVFKGGYLFICNRGEGSVTDSGKAIVQQFKIDPKKVTPNLMKELRMEIGKLDAQKGRAILYETLPKSLSPTGRIEKVSSKLIKSSLQRVGNCTFTSFSQAVRTALVSYCQTEEEQKAVETKYRQFLLEAGMKQFERHLEGLAMGHPHFDPDFVEDASIAVLEKVTQLRQNKILTEDEYALLLQKYPKVGQLITTISNQTLINAIEKAEKHFYQEDADKRRTFLFDQLLLQNPEGLLPKDVSEALFKIAKAQSDEQGIAMFQRIEQRFQA